MADKRKNAYTSVRVFRRGRRAVRNDFIPTQDKKTQICDYGSAGACFADTVFCRNKNGINISTDFCTKDMICFLHKVNLYLFQGGK